MCMMHPIRIQMINKIEYEISLITSDERCYDLTHHDHRDPVDGLALRLGPQQQILCDVELLAARDGVVVGKLGHNSIRFI